MTTAYLAALARTESNEVTRTAPSSIYSPMRARRAHTKGNR